MNCAERASPGPFLDLDGIRQGLVKFGKALVKNMVGGEKTVTRLVTDWRRTWKGSIFRILGAFGRRLP